MVIHQVKEQQLFVVYGSQYSLEYTCSGQEDYMHVIKQTEHNLNTNMILNILINYYNYSIFINSKLCKKQAYIYLLSQQYDNINFLFVCKQKISLDKISILYFTQNISQHKNYKFKIQNFILLHFYHIKTYNKVYTIKINPFQIIIILNLHQLCLNLHSFHKRYPLMKGSISLNPKYASLNLKNVKVIKANPLIACDQKHLYFKGLKTDDTVTSVRWQGKDVVNSIYLKKYQIILALCQNYRVYALTQNLQEITNIPGWQSNYNIAFDYIQQYGILLMIGAEIIQIMKVSIETNIKKTKFLSSMRFTMKKLMPQPLAANLALPWNKGYGVNIPQNLLYVWSPESVAFLKISNLQVLSQSNSLTKKQNPITCVYFSNYFKYTLTGTLCGQVRVWRLPISKAFQHQNILIHTFQAHTKAIKQIIQSPYNQKIIMTSAQDLQVCVWSMQTLQMLRKFQFFGIYSQVILKSIDQAFVMKDNTLGQLNFGQALQFITQITSNIMMVDHKQSLSLSSATLQNGQGSSLKSLTLTLDENLGIVFNKDLLLQSKQLNKMQLKYIYPPLKAKSIKQIVSSPFTESTQYMLSQNGEIFRVQISPFSIQYIGVSSKIQQVYNIQFTVDKQKHPLNQLPSMICFLPLLPPQFDSQIRDVEDNGNKSNRNNQVQNKLTVTQAVQKYNEKKLMTIGCQKGTIIFVSCDSMNKIYTRLTYHRQSIVFIESIKQYKSSLQKRDFNPINSLIASFCAEHYLKLIKFNYQKSSAQCILTYYAGPQIKYMKGFDTFLTFVFYKGEFQITQIDNKGKMQDLCCRRSSVIENHEGEILSIDYERFSEIIMTTGSDNRIKLWTTKKILLYDILIDDGLSYSFFVTRQEPNDQSLQKSLLNKINVTLNNNDKVKQSNQQTSEQKPLLPRRPKPKPVDFDLIILHSQKLLYFRNIPLSFRPNQIQLFNSNPQLLDDQKVPIRQIFQNLNSMKDNLPITVNCKQTKTPNSPVKQNKNQSIIKRNKQRIRTQPSLNSNNVSSSKKYFIQQSRVTNNGNSNASSPLKRLHLKTQEAIQRSYQNTRRQHEQSQHLVIRTQKKKQNKYLISQKQRGSTQTRLKYKSVLQKPSLISQSSIDATKKHLQQLSSLKQQINGNRPVLPKLNSRKQQIFDQFMRQKLVSKNVLTRRDITINRIIMKNIIKQHFEEESKMVGLRLDY